MPRSAGSRGRLPGVMTPSDQRRRSASLTIALIERPARQLRRRIIDYLISSSLAADDSCMRLLDLELYSLCMKFQAECTYDFQDRGEFGIAFRR